MSLTRRQFIQTTSTAAAVAAAAPALPAPAPHVIGPVPYTGLHDFSKVLGAVRDVYSDEIFFAALPVMKPVMKLDALRARPKICIPKFNRISDHAAADMACRGDAERASSGRYAQWSRRPRTYFDFGNLGGRFRAIVGQLTARA